MKIESITILKTSTSSDEVYLNTDLQEGTWPYTGKASFKAHVAMDKGVEWVKLNFPEISEDKIKIINQRRI